MKLQRVALFAPLLLASCITTTFQDTLVRARLEGPLPHLPVHTPRTDTTLVGFQASIALTTIGKNNLPVSLIEPEKADKIGNTGSARKVDWNQEYLTGSGEISALVGQHMRLFAGLQGDLDKKATWLGAGFVMGRKSALEANFAFGHTTISRELEGLRVTTLTENCADQDLNCVPNSTSTAGQDTTTWDRAEVEFLRYGLTWSARDGGPWLEYAYTSYSNLARTVQGNWKYDGAGYMLGAGWTFPTPVGRFIAGGRVETVGDELAPSLLTQWTGDFSLD